MSDLGPGDFSRLTDGRYRLRFDHSGIELEVDRLRRRFDELVGELTVRCDLAGAQTIEGVLCSSDFNFSSLTARQRHAGVLANRARTNSKLDWHGALDWCCQLVLRAEREGQAPVRLAEVARPIKGGDDHEVHGFSLPRRHPAIAFGDGGGGKSLIALWLAGTLASRGLRVGFFDYELAAPDHRERLEQLFGADLPADLWYVRCEAPLARDSDRLRRLVAEQRLDYLVFDSVGYACDGAPESAEAALGYFQALRRLGPVGSLHLAHISKAEGADRRPFGSAFWHNSARATWFIKPSDDSAASDTLSIGVFERKRNLGRQRAPFGLEVQFTPERTTFHRVDIATVPEFASRVSINQRIASALRGGSMTREALAAELDTNPETLRRTLNRAISKGQLVRFPGPAGEEHIGLAARQAS